MVVEAVVEKSSPETVSLVEEALPRVTFPVKVEVPKVLVPAMKAEAEVVEKRSVTLFQYAIEVVEKACFPKLARPEPALLGSARRLGRGRPVNGVPDRSVAGIDGVRHGDASAVSAACPAYEGGIDRVDGKIVWRREFGHNSAVLADASLRRTEGAAGGPWKLSPPPRLRQALLRAQGLAPVAAGGAAA